MKDQYHTSKKALSKLYSEAQQENTLPMFAVTSNTQDFGEKFVARLILVKQGYTTHTHHIAVSDTHEQIRALMPDACHVIERAKDDDPVIVETWI